MFGLDRGNALKINIVETLEAAGEIVSASTLHELLSFSNLTILSTAKELQDDLVRIYPQGEVRLVIDKNGLLLQRHGSSLQYFFANVFSADSSYTIIRDLFLRRKIITDELGSAHGLSPSTLRRKIADINLIFKGYNLHISVSKFTTLNGSENDIRLMFFTFLSAIHKQFSRVPWIEGKEVFLKQAHDILEYLSLPSYSYNSDITAFWLYIQAMADELADSTLDAKQFALLDDFNIPEKPDFLADWTQTSWYFFYLSLYVSGKYDISLLYPESFEHHYETTAAHWIEVFEANFTSLNRRKKKKATQKIYQQVLTSLFFTVNGDMTAMVKTFDYAQFAEEQPTYAKLFDTFWSEYTTTADNQSIVSPYYKTMSVLLALTVCPITEMLPEVDIYFLSNQNHLTETYLKQQFIQLLQNDFNIVFSSNPINADIILSPSPVPDDFEHYNKPSLLIRIPFRKSDLDEFTIVAKRLIDAI